TSPSARAPRTGDRQGTRFRWLNRSRSSRCRCERSVDFRGAACARQGRATWCYRLEPSAGPPRCRRRCRLPACARWWRDRVRRARTIRRGVDHALDRKRTSNEQVAVIEVRTLIRRRFGAFARHHAKLGQTICAEHIFELERTNIEDGQRSILHGTAALVLIRTQLILDA